MHVEDEADSGIAAPADDLIQQGESIGGGTKTKILLIRKHFPVEREPEGIDTG